VGSDRSLAVFQRRRRDCRARRAGALRRRLFRADQPFNAFNLRFSARDLAARRIAATAIAAERYRRAHGGTPPPSLDALIPGFLPRVPEAPYSGQPLVLTPDADGYTIYSLDSDRRDDGGILYGFGAAQTKHIGPQPPRDFGIRVPLKPVK
jgi:hypothetical protein